VIIRKPQKKVSKKVKIFLKRLERLCGKGFYFLAEQQA